MGQTLFVRRLVSYVIDVVIGYIVIGIFMFLAQSSGLQPQLQMFILISGFVAEFWLFWLLPDRYMIGQTLGRKYAKLVVLDKHTNKPLPGWKYFARDYMYGVAFGFATVPFEAIYILFQLITRTKYENLVLARDVMFQTKVVEK